MGIENYRKLLVALRDAALAKKGCWCRCIGGTVAAIFPNASFGLRELDWREDHFPAPGAEPLFAWRVGNRREDAAAFGELRVGDEPGYSVAKVLYREVLELVPAEGGYRAGEWPADVLEIYHAIERTTNAPVESLPDRAPNRVDSGAGVSCASPAGYDDDYGVVGK